MKPEADSTADAAEQRGLSCRNCGGGRLMVVYTRAKPNGVVARRRECRDCGRRLTTWERAIGTAGR